MTKKDEKFDMRSVDPKTLNGAHYNPRKISEHDFDSLCRSIREFGFVEPVVVQRSTNAIIGGHQRTRAAIVLDLPTISAVYLDIDDLSAKALNITLNRVQGTFDTPLLQQALADLEAGGKDLGLTGFTREEIAKFDTPLETAHIDQMSLRPAPSLVWVLIGIPLSKFGEAQPHIAALEANAALSVQSSRDQ